MTISIIVPVLNEAPIIESFLSQLRERTPRGRTPVDRCDLEIAGIWATDGRPQELEIINGTTDGSCLHQVHQEAARVLGINRYDAGKGIGRTLCVTTLAMQDAESLIPIDEGRLQRYGTRVGAPGQVQ